MQTMDDRNTDRSHLDRFAKISYLKKFTIKQRLIFFAGFSLFIVVAVVIIQIITSASIERASRIREYALDVDANILQRQNSAYLLVSNSDTSLVTVYEKLEIKGRKSVRTFIKSGAMENKDAKELTILNNVTDSLFAILHKSVDEKMRVVASLNDAINESDKSVGTILSLLESREADLQMMGERLDAKESEFLNVARDGRIFFLTLKGIIQSILIDPDHDVKQEFKLLLNRKNSLFDAYRSFSKVLKNDSYLKASEKFISSTQTALTLSEALIKTVEEQYTINQKFAKQVIKTSELTSKQLENADTKVLVAKGTIVTVYIIVLVLSSLILIALSISLIKSITSPIDRLLQIMDAVGRGDFSVESPVDSSDEISKITSSLNSTLKNLRGMFRQIKTGSDTIFMQTEKVNNVATTISMTIKTQRDKSAELSATGNRISSNVTRISDATVDLSHAVTGVAASIEEMGVSIAEVSRRCQEESSVAIQADSDAKNAETIMIQLGESASQVSTVIDVIKKISEQTKLLALNASIESARAGAAGKGFSVVANEVNELAKQTAEAADEVRKQVAGMQNNTTQAVDAIKKIVETIHLISEHSDSISATVGQQNDTVNSIARTMAHTSASSKTIADNVTTSSHGLTEVNTGIHDVDSSLQGTVRSIDEIHQRIKELHDLGTDLQKIVNKFTI